MSEPRSNEWEMHIATEASVCFCAENGKRGEETIYDRGWNIREDELDMMHFFLLVASILFATT